MATYPMLELNRRKAALTAAGTSIYDFGTGDPKEPVPDFIRQRLRESIPEVCSYPTVTGSRALRTAIAAYIARRFGPSLDPETQILPTSGSKEAVFHLPQLVIDPNAADRLVVFPDPGYPVYERGTRFAGGIPHPQVLSGDFIQRPWELPEDVLARTRLLWLNHPHNPTGAVMDRDHLARCVALCERWDILLVNDECYADIYQDTPPHSLLEVADRGVLVLHSLSKRSGMTGIRSGFVAGDPDAIAQFKKLRSNIGVAPMEHVNEGARAAWADDDHCADYRATFAEKRAILMAFFQEVGIEVVASQATFYLWIRCPGSASDIAWTQKLLEAGIVVTPGSMLGITDAGAGYVRVALVPTVEQCRVAVTVWRRAMEEH